MTQDASPPEKISPQGGAYIAGDVYTGGGDFVAGDKYEIHPPSLKDARARRDQLVLLEKVRQFWVEGVLEKSLHQAALLELGMETRPDLIAHPWETVVELPDQEPAPLPAGKRIADVFDDSGRTLLILGEPGSGKTITLLELARALLGRAEKDPAQPIPVVLNLSTWGERRPPFADWIVEELNAKYQVPKKMARQWLADFDLLLLLDGLDEMLREHQDACVQAINRFGSENGLSGIAACSRMAEYGALKTRLKMGGAIYLQPLKDEQIHEYLETMGDFLGGLRETLGKDPALREMAQTPLMLSVMGLAYRELPASALPGRELSPQERRKHVFDTYVRRMFERRKPPSLSSTWVQSVRWISWLARKMTGHSQSIFLVEHLQPSWLEEPLYRGMYTLISRASGGLVIGWLFWFLVLLLSYEPVIASQAPNLIKLSGLFLTGLFVCTFTVIGGTGIGFIQAIFFEFEIWREKKHRKKPSVLAGAVVNLIANALPGVFVGGLGAYIIVSEYSQTEGGPIVIILALFMFFISGGFTFLVYLLTLPASGEVTQDIQPVESFVWAWKFALRGAFWGWIGGIAFGLFVLIIFWLIVIVDNGSLSTETLPTFVVTLFICGGLPSILSATILGTLFGMQERQIPEKTVPNQGISLSAQNALKVFFFLGGTASLIGLFIYGFAVLLFNFWFAEQGVINAEYVIGFATMIAFIGGIRRGGFAVLQHYSLRIILVATKKIPGNLLRFLDHATDLIFLRKVGGGYIFVHRLLQEHFAAMDMEAF